MDQVKTMPAAAEYQPVSWCRQATIDTGPKACILLDPQLYATEAPILKHSKWVGCFIAVDIQQSYVESALLSFPL